MRGIISGIATVALSIAAMAGLAFGAVSNQAMAGPASVAAYDRSQQQVISYSPAARDTRVSPETTSEPKAAARASVSGNSLYKVVAGDSLSKISAKMYGKAADWPVIYYANAPQINNPNIIFVGQTMRIPPLPRHIPAAPQPKTPAAAPAAVVAVSASPPSQRQTNYIASGGGYSVTSAFQACVIRAESGGNPNIWNASGHWGLYQFSYGTWVAAGGAGYLFGKSGGGYQTQIFWDAYRMWGTSPWAPYDGC